MSTIVVAGGTRGIGLELAKAMTRPGDVALLGYWRDHATAEEAARSLRAHGVDARIFGGDLGTPEGVQGLVTAAAEAGGAVDHVVHCAVQVVPGGLLSVDRWEWEHALAVNGSSLLWLVRAAAPHLVRGSTVLYVTSRGARYVVSGYASVGPAKSLAEALVRYLAVELAPQGVRVNALAPGTQDTAALRQVFGPRTDEVIAGARAKNPSGRLVEPADYTALARFLLTPAASMITGQVHYVQGGADLLG